MNFIQHSPRNIGISRRSQFQVGNIFVRDIGKDLTIWWIPLVYTRFNSCEHHEFWF